TAGETANHRYGECEDQDEHLRHDHHLQVDLEAGPHVRERDPEALRAEEGLENLVERVHRLPVLRRYFKVGIAPKFRLNHFFWSFAIVPFFVSFLIAAST